MAKENIEGEDFILKKIRHYQGSIADFETFWNQKIEQGEKEISPETKDCKAKNDDLNKAFEIKPVTNDNDNDNKPEPLTDEEKKKVKGDEKEEPEKKDKDEKKSKKSKKDKGDSDDDK